jgi:chemotaxis protein CheX
MSDILTLPERLDLPAATELAEAFSGRRRHDLSVNCTEVALLGTNCLQVLISAAQTWAADGYALTFVDLSSAFSSQLALMGLGLDDLTEGA